MDKNARVKVKLLKDVGKHYKAGKEYVVLLTFARSLFKQRAIDKIPHRDIKDEKGNVVGKEVIAIQAKTAYEERLEAKKKAKPKEDKK